MPLTFGPYRLKRQDRQVEGPDGPVDLSARGFDLLCVLLDRSGEIVSKDALFDAVWPGVVVEENTLQVLCCTNPVRDSSRESSVVAGRHEQTYPPRLQDQELARLQ